MHGTHLGHNTMATTTVTPATALAAAAAAAAAILRASYAIYRNRQQ